MSGVKTFHNSSDNTMHFGTREGCHDCFKPTSKPAITYTTVQRGHASPLPADSKARKDVPLAAVLDYFPKALCAIAALAKAGNDKHNPGEPLHWSRSKSNDHEHCLVRHFLERGTLDTDGHGHSVKVAMRALMLLETEIEAATGAPISRGSKP